MLLGWVFRDLAIPKSSSVRRMKMTVPSPEQAPRTYPSALQLRSLVLPENALEIAKIGHVVLVDQSETELS